MKKNNIDCFLIEPAKNFISLLSKPITSYKKSKESNVNLYGKWIHYIFDLYNNRCEFLLMAKTKINSSRTKTEILERTYKDNYRLMNEHFEQINNNNVLTGDLEIELNSRKSFIDNESKIEKYINIENKNKYLLESTIFRLVVFIFQYLQEFEEKSININLWNYCLKSSTFSYRAFFIGLFILACQYTWIISLIYIAIDEFEPNYDPIIILITISSTIIAILYSFDTISSFITSIPLYKFMIKLYDQNPELVLSKKDKKLSYYKNRGITIKKWHLYYNFIADLMSNLILPIIIPVINFFIILNSESVVDAILNCMAIFFIIQIDEELYNITDYKSDQLTINFTRWIISTIYCKHFPEFIDIFKYECDNWQKNVVDLVKKYKKNKISPFEMKPNEITIELN